MQSIDHTLQKEQGYEQETVPVHQRRKAIQGETVQSFNCSKSLLNYTAVPGCRKQCAVLKA